MNESWSKTNLEKAKLKRDRLDEEFSWYATEFHIWPGEHCPVLRRQANMGIPIRTTDDDIEDYRTS